MTYNPTYADRQSRPLDREIEQVDWLAHMLDSRYRIPGTGIRFGWDSILGLIPGLGDTVTTVPTAWMIWIGYNRGIARHRLAQMALNTGIDYVIGSIPLVGDIFDIGFKANLKNAAILKRELSKAPR